MDPCVTCFEGNASKQSHEQRKPETSHCSAQSYQGISDLDTNHHNLKSTKANCIAALLCLKIDQVSAALQVLEKNVEKLIDDVYMLGVKGVSLSERQAATKRTVQAIQDACALCSRPSSQVLRLFHAHGICLPVQCICLGSLNNLLIRKWVPCAQPLVRLWLSLFSSRTILEHANSSQASPRSQILPFFWLLDPQILCSQWLLQKLLIRRVLPRQPQHDTGMPWPSLLVKHHCSDEFWSVHHSSMICVHT